MRSNYQRTGRNMHHMMQSHDSTQMIILALSWLTSILMSNRHLDGVTIESESRWTMTHLLPHHKNSLTYQDVLLHIIYARTVFIIIIFFFKNTI